MKNSKFLVISLFFTLIFVGSVKAQNFVSVKGGFSIELPANAAKVDAITGANGQGENITWNLKQGRIAITYAENSPGLTFKTAKDFAAFFEGFKQGIVELKPIDLVESHYDLDPYYGTALSAKLNGNQYRWRALATLGTKYFIISGFAYADQPNADSLILKALDSFSLTTAPAK